MITGYTYELWNGSKVLGEITLISPVIGKYCLFYEKSILKQKYGQCAKFIKVPICGRIIEKTYKDYTYRICLDIRKKSKRQINIILENISL
jgi:hypothetical protein